MYYKVFAKEKNSNKDSLFVYDTTKEKAMMKFFQKTPFFFGTLFVGQVSDNPLEDRMEMIRVEPAVLSSSTKIR